MIDKYVNAYPWVLVAPFLMLFSGPVPAHEFWLEPARYEVFESRPVAVSIRNGENFLGDSLPYLPAAFVRYSLLDPKGTYKIKAQIGDMAPVVSLPNSAGLKTLQYESVISRLQYSSYEQFKEFTLKEGIEWVLQDHLAKFGQQGPVREIYRRFTKLLISAGSAVGADSPTGMELELIALDNPYADSQGDMLRMQLLYQGTPLAGAQVTTYTRLTKQPAKRHIEITDQQGIAMIPRIQNGEYLVNAVHIRPPGMLEKFLNGTQWETLWASITFQTSGDSTRALLSGSNFANSNARQLP